MKREPRWMKRERQTIIEDRPVRLGSGPCFELIQHHVPVTVSSSTEEEAAHVLKSPWRVRGRCAGTRAPSALHGHVMCRMFLALLCKSEVMV